MAHFRYNYSGSEVSGGRIVTGGNVVETAETSSAFVSAAIKKSACGGALPPTTGADALRLLQARTTPNNIRGMILRQASFSPRFLRNAPRGTVS